MTDDLWQFDATDLARLIRLGQVSSREATQACLSRLHAVNPMINAVVRVLEEEAMAAAEAADAAQAQGAALEALPKRVGTGHLLCVADAPSGFHAQILTGAALSPRPAPRHPRALAGSSCVRSGWGSGVSSPRGLSKQCSRAIAGRGDRQPRSDPNGPQTLGQRNRQGRTRAV